MYKILVLEDDELFLETLEDFLEEEGFEVEIATDGEIVLSKVYEKNFDLYLFDINVPKLDGINLLKQLREKGDETPAIYLTSYKQKEKLMEGFLIGCDDYLKKPIDLDELLLRIHSILKRSGKVFKNITINDKISFDPINRRVLDNNIDLYLPAKLIDLLELFLEKKDRVITKDMIVDRLWNYDEDYSEGSIRVYINNLKKILGKDCIKNIKGIGYKFEL